MSRSVPSRAPRQAGAPAFLGPLLLGGLAGAAEPRDLQVEEGAELEVTIYRIWASDEDRGKGLPREVAQFLEQLRKASKKKFFRLEEPPRSETLRQGKPVKMRLPAGYEVRWSLEDDKGKPAIHQVLVNPKKLESVVILKQSPVINHLESIRNEKETFLLFVRFEKARS